jgi:hypothetical protein
MQAERSHSLDPRTPADRPQGQADDAEPSAEPMFRQVGLTAARALALRPEPAWTIASLRQGAELLAAIAARHGLTAPEPAALALLCHPLRTKRADWSWQQLLPVHGLAPASALGDEARMVWTLGGTSLETETRAELGALRRVYSFALGDYLPHYKHRLSQPCIYHRLLGRLERTVPAAFLMSVSFPVVLTIADEG